MHGDPPRMRPITSILRRIASIAEQYPFEGGKEHLRNEICSIVSQITPSVLEIQFPTTLPRLPVEVLCGNICRNVEKFECGLFAFPQSGNKLPLHDHPNMEGYIKAVAGKLLITSFSFLDLEEERKLRIEKALEGNDRIKPARFEGSFICTLGGG